MIACATSNADSKSRDWPALTCSCAASRIIRSTRWISGRPILRQQAAVALSGPDSTPLVGLHPAAGPGSIGGALRRVDLASEASKQHGGFSHKASVFDFGAFVDIP